jgi:hypothetical protein
LFHFNCFKRPLPPALATKAIDETTTTGSVTPVTPTSYAARRAQRQQSIDMKRG